ncbi:MAG: hypothetical protein J7K75_05940 [Desulfuromonas sp.]|nr:hypothetical protein [Desulfuromonas sp.]
MTTPLRPFALSDLFTSSYELWKQHLGNLLLLSALFLLLCWIPLLNLALSAGYIRYILRLCRNEQVEIGELFRAWDCFIPLLLYALLQLVIHFFLGVLPLIGVPLAAAALIVTVPGTIAVIENRMDTITAFKWSLNTVRHDPVGWSVTLVAAALLFSLGTLFFGLGALLTLPLATILFLNQYLRHQPHWQ